jgi:microcystin-dependent protein
MSVALQFKLTQTGQAAVWNANNTGTSLNLTHIQFGSGNRAPSGTETALLSPQQAVAIAAGFSVSSTQIRMSAIFTGNQNYVIREVGLWAGDPAVAGSKLVGYWSQAAGDLAMKSPGVDFIFSHDMTLDAAVPAGSLTILADNAQSAMLAMITAHEAKADPHPQYTTNAEVNALIEARVGDYVTSTNVGNAYTVALDPVVVAYTAKTAFAFKASAANTGATTLNAGGGAKALVREDGTVMVAGDIASGAVVTVVFDTATDSFRVTELVASQMASAIQNQSYTAISTAGAAPAFTGTVAPAITAYSAGQRFRIKFHAGATGVSTLNLHGLGAKSLKQYDYAGGKVNAVVVANQLVDVEYDGADFVLLDPLPGFSVQPGEVQFFAMNAAPTGYLKANGAAISRTAYAALFTVIGTTFGAGDGGTTFNLPDLRGEFVRGWDDSRGVDTSRTFGSWQGSQNISHTHGGGTGNAGAHGHTAWTDTQGNHTHSVLVYRANDFNSGAYVTGSDDPWDAGAWVNGTSAAGNHTHGVGIGTAADHWHSISADGGTEARPRNIALLACIKF